MGWWRLSCPEQCDALAGLHDMAHAVGPSAVRHCGEREEMVLREFVILVLGSVAPPD